MFTHDIHSFTYVETYLNIYWMINTKLYTDIHVPQMMYPYDFSNPVTLF